MRQMRDEVARNKKMENKLNQQMEGILKENRKKEVQLKRMKDEKKQRDLVLKRKQEEVRGDILQLVKKMVFERSIRKWFSENFSPPLQYNVF